MSEPSHRSTSTFLFMARIARNPLHQRTRSHTAGLVLFVQLGLVLFALMGTDQIMLLGSAGVARPNTLLKVSLPRVQEGSLWTFNDHCEHIVIGWPLDGSHEPRIQLADQFASLADIQLYVREDRVCYYDRLPPKRTMVIYADADMPMALITAVKQELRYANQLRICYAVTTMP
jgi:hypothetical protein